MGIFHVKILSKKNLFLFYEKIINEMLFNYSTYIILGEG